MNSLALILMLAALLLLSFKRLRNSSLWRATVTPLASIIGSGFLIVAPLLHAVLGKWALAGIVLLSFVAYLIGSVIRFNIRYAEPVLRTENKDVIQQLEMLARWVLGFAYAISVAFYTSLLIAFLFDSVSVHDPALSRLSTSGLLLAIILVAWLWGTHGLETIELGAVTLKLAIIISIIITLGVYDVRTGFEWFKHDAIKVLTGWETAAMLAGMLMVTQGFETTRFMGDAYRLDVRVRACRNAQLIAIVLYVTFIGVTCPLFVEFPIDALNETTVSKTLGQAILVLPALVLVAATASQLSAALADTLGGGGLLKEVTPFKLPVKSFYIIIAGIAIGLIWTSNVFEIINYASKGFAAYYLIQVVIAIILLHRGVVREYMPIRLAGGYLLALILCFVVVASIPAPHG